MATHQELYLVLLTFIIITTSYVVDALYAGPNVYQKLDITFCLQMKQIRSAWSTESGFDYMYKNPQLTMLKQVQMRLDFMEDYFTFQNFDSQHYITGFHIPHLNMKLLIGITRAQIEGDFANRNDEFELSYAVYWDDHLEQFWKHEYHYRYANICYLRSCISNFPGNVFRVYRLHFCRDFYAVKYFPLKDPCYTFSGKNTTYKLYYNQTVTDPKTNKTITREVYNQTCVLGNPFRAVPNFCGHQNQTKAVLNSLFPYEFSAQSRGGLFRSLVFFRGKLYWLENSPSFQYRYLEDITDPHGNYSLKWKEAKVEKEDLVEKYYFASAFVYPRYGNNLDQVYFLLLPKNFTVETIAYFRRVKTMLPLDLFEKNYTLDEIIGQNCTKWTALMEPEVSGNPQIVVSTLVAFMILFLLCITLLTYESNAKGGSGISQTHSDHAQSQLLEKLRK